MKDNLDELTDDELFASYEAYKALLDAGLTKDQALSRSGLTAKIVKDFEMEEEEDDLDYKDDSKEVYDEDEDADLIGDWKEEDISAEDDSEAWNISDDEDLLGGDMGAADWDDKF